MKLVHVLFVGLFGLSACGPSEQAERQGANTAVQHTELVRSSFGGAVPINPELWIKTGDIRFSEIQYVPVKVILAFEITEAGRAINCKVASPSSSEFAPQFCSAIEQNARFEPARDIDGSPKNTNATTTVRFELPS